MDTCQIEKGENGQFDLFLNGELFLSKKHMGKFFDIEDVKKCLTLIKDWNK